MRDDSASFSLGCLCGLVVSANHNNHGLPRILCSCKADRLSSMNCTILICLAPQHDLLTHRPGFRHCESGTPSAPLCVSLTWAFTRLPRKHSGSDSSYKSGDKSGAWGELVFAGGQPASRERQRYHQAGEEGSCLEGLEEWKVARAVGRELSTHPTQSDAVPCFSVTCQPSRELIHLDSR